MDSRICCCSGLREKSIVLTCPFETRIVAAFSLVLAGLDPAIHHLREETFRRGWMRGSSPRMTTCVCNRRHDLLDRRPNGKETAVGVVLAEQHQADRRLAGAVTWN